MSLYLLETGMLLGLLLQKSPWMVTHDFIFPAQWLITYLREQSHPPLSLYKFIFQAFLLISLVRKKL